LNSKEDLLNAILDSIGEGLFTIDKNFKITSFNRSAERITGYAKEQVLNKFCKNIFRSENCTTGCPLTLTLEKGENLYDYDLTIKDKNARSIQVKVNTAILYNADKEPVGGVVSFRENMPCLSLNDKLQPHSHFDDLVGMSQKMREIFTLIEEITDSDASVLILGESGTGKEMVANAIQRHSNRRNKPFIKVNCAVFPETLLASELFGHVKGAFTGATSDRVGRFEAADGGTIFLDEIAETPLQVQIQLLRVLQDGNFERIGESVTRKVDVRVIAATNMNLEQAFREGKFREDLFYRLNVIPVTLPPLRERKIDIPFLVQFFLKKYQLLTSKPITEIDDDVMDALVNFDWPGNVRELENIIAYLFARTKGGIITNEKLPHRIQTCNSPAQIVQHDADSGTDIRVILSKNRWNKTLAARELGIGRTTLWRRMKELGLE
jgi:PAS domain S-box-containing protein